MSENDNTENNTNKKIIGHNRYQLEIQDLKTQIELLNNSCKIKDEELALFKDNLTSMQIDLQNKKSDIDKSVIENNNLLNENQLLDKKITNILNMNRFLIKNLEKEKDTLLQEKSEYLKHLQDITKTKNTLQFKYDDLKVKYQQTSQLLEVKTNDYIQLQDNHTKLIKESNLLKELNNIHQNEINNVKNELCKSKDNNSILKRTILDKDNYITEMTRNITNSKPQFKKFKDVKEVVKIESTNDESQPLKITRGLKLSKR